MKKKKNKSSTSEDENFSDEPRVFKILVKNRRDFLKKIAGGTLGIASLGQLLSGCEDTMDIEIEKTGDRCTCHVVCTCDKDKEGWDSEWDMTYRDGVCTCDMVCTCNTVCTCDTDSGGGGGTTTYWYPN